MIYPAVIEPSAAVEFEPLHDTILANFTEVDAPVLGARVL